MGNGSGTLRPGVLLLLASLAVVPPAAADSQADTTTGDAILLGSRTFDENCGKCHQPDGFGEAGLYPSLHDPALLDDRDRLIRTMLHGRSRPAGGVDDSPEALMPALDYLSNAEIVAVIAFITHSWGKETLMVTEQDVEAARAGLPGQQVAD
jgi:mono/diheme cytochrome c family protein